MRLLLAVALLAYPAAVILLIDQAGPLALAGLFAGIAGARLLMAKHLSGSAVGLGLLAIAILCAATYLAQSLVAVKLYPAAISATAAFWCAYTLWHAPSAIERLLNVLARSTAGLPPGLRDRIPLNHALSSATNGALAPSAVQRTYMIGLTKVWFVFFIANTALALWSATQTSTEFWALYNGVISYLLIGVLLIGESMYRGVYQRKHADVDTHTELDANAKR